MVGTRGRELGCWRWKNILAFRFPTGNCFIRYTYGFRCLCSRRQPFRTVSLLLMLIARESNKAHSLCFPKQRPSSYCFSKGCIWALSAVWAKVYPVSISLISRPWQAHVSLLSEWQDFRTPCWQSQSIFLLLPSWNNFGAACRRIWKPPWRLGSFLGVWKALIPNGLSNGNFDEDILGRRPRTSAHLLGKEGGPLIR